jgi:bile acid:Na+ symporter, BASS family
MTHKIRVFVLPVAIVLGFFFHVFFASLNILTPYLIFAMLFLTLCSLNVKKMHISMLHLWLLLFQMVLSLALYFILRPFNEILAQGALVVILTPTATSATVVAVMLGANLANLATYTLICNLAIVVASPFYFSFIGTHVNLPFFLSSLIILKKVTPLIVIPFILALLFQKFLPKLTIQIIKRQNISFYFWAVALTIVVGRTIDYIYLQDSSQNMIIILMMALSLFLCIIQFAFGRWVGGKYNDKVTGGQSLGQKNIIISIWMAQTYLNPLASVVPATYSLWQNLFNSYQLWRKKPSEN